MHQAEMEQLGLSALNGKVNLLLVDDRKDGLLALEAVLSCPEYNLVTANSGHEALSYLFHNDFAVILLDVQMPVLDGFETAKMIKQIDRAKDTPIIFITAISKEESHIRFGYESGAVDYIFKPFDPNVLKPKVAVFVDIYRKNLKLRKQAKLFELQERERRTELEIENTLRYNSLADAIPHIVWKAQPHGEISYFNRVWFNYTGLDLEQSINRRWQAAFDPMDLNRLLFFWQESMRTGAPFEAECRIHCGSNNSYRWHLVRVAAEMRDGAIVAWLGTCTDIHDRKEAEFFLQKQTQELLRSNRDLEQFAYVASHDLQEPLRMVTSYVQLLASRYRGNLDETAEEFMNFITDGALRAHELINDLLEFSRAGREGKPFALVDCKTVLDRVVSSLKLTIEENRAMVTYDSMPQVMGDEIKLNQLFQNLIENGIKFREKSIPLVHITAKASNENWIFSVKDNGIGIHPDFFDRIFVIFQRLHTREEYPGTGIGLAICKKIVERHGGHIWVESELGAGSNFCFTIPLSPGEIKSS